MAAACADLRVWINGSELQVTEQGGLTGVTRARLPKGLGKGDTVVIQVARPAEPVAGLAGLLGQVWVR